MNRQIEDVYELAPLQQGILYHCLANDDPSAYAITLAVTLEGGVDLPAFREAWRQVVARTAVLRTSLHWEGLEKPVQVVHREVSLPLAEHDARDWPEREREARLAALAEAQHGRRLALGEAPLFRLSLIRTGETTHRLVWTFHHVLLEGWSASLVLQDVLAAYAALARGQTPQLPDRLPYRELILRLQSDGDRAATETFWRESLAGFAAPSPLDLPRDEAAAGTESAGTVRVALSPDSTAALADLGRRHRLTLATLAQGAYAILLARYTDGAEVSFGNVVSGRSIDLPGAESMVGLLVNTVPARVRVPRDEPLLPWLRRLQADRHAAQPHEHASLVDIQGWSEVPRGTPLFDTLFAFENWAGGLAAPAPGGGGLRLADLEVVEGSSGYPLSVAVSPGPPLGLTLRFDRSRVGSAAAVRLARHLQALLEGMARGLDGAVGDLSILDDQERRRLVSGWNETQREYRSGATVLDLFEERVQSTPGAPAVVSGDQVLGYRELDRRAGQVARRLRAEGIGRGDGVAVCLERSPDLVIALLGILKAGAHYVALDPAHPAARLAFMVSDSGASLVVTSGGLADTLAQAAAKQLHLPLPEEQERRTEPAERPRPDDLAYVIYTSGSTGTPKGVAVGHRGLANLVSWHCRTYGVGPGDRGTLVASPGFDASVWELWPYLCAGAAVEIPEEEVRSEPARLGAWLAERGVTHSFLPTPLAEALLGEDVAWARSPRFLLTGGDRLRAVEAGSLPFVLVNHYGPTEGTVVTTAAAVPPGASGDPPIGRPIENVRTYVLDRRMDPVPVGVPGELFVGGAGLARGYVGRPDLTAECFVPSPFGDGERLYRTGDLVRWREDGQLEFLGRRDHQVKVRGFRIELGEIEAALRQDPDVADAVVVVREDRRGERRLTAYVVPRRPAEGEARSVPSTARARLQASLPEHMVPSAFVLLETLPLAPSGKVDRRALPEPEEDQARDASAPPRTPIEEALVEIWRGVLDRDTVGVHDSFFDLGGHSLLATRVVSLVRRSLGTDVSLRAFFEAPTVRGLGRAIERARGDRESVAPPLVRAPGDGDAPLSFAQQRLWFLDQMGSGSAYNVPLAVRLRGALDVRALRAALDDLVARHETLRTTFPAREGRPAQAIATETHVELAEIDLRTLAAEDREHEARRLAAEETRRPFDLARGPLLRAMLLALGDQDRVLLVTIHHIVTDGWSMGVLTRELAAHYAARRRGEAAALPPLPVQYADFARWQRDWLQGEALERQLGYWRERLGGTCPGSSCPPTAPGAPSRPFVAGRARSPSLPPCAAASPRSAARKGPRCSWSCSRASRRSCIATPARGTSSSARRSRTATAASSRA